jgi:putative ABC transport system substrate-binding protein
MHFDRLARREFITLIGSAAATWPVPSRAQQAAVPVVGYLHPAFPAPNAHLAGVMRQVLADAGFVEGRNLTIEYRFAEGNYDRLALLAAELVRRQAAVIVAPNTPAALAAKAASATIPVVFSAADDPVKLGLVASIARPGGNVTGVHYFNTGLAAKQFGLLRELVPNAVRFGLLVNPNNTNAEEVKREVTGAALAHSAQVDVVVASDSRQIETAFATLVGNRADALIVGADPLYYGRRLQLATLATRHGIPAVYNSRDYPEVGGLMSYGTSLNEVYRLLGGYAGRILKGTKPADLPVVQATKFEFVINLPTARALGIEVPPTLLARADEVIE